MQPFTAHLFLLFFVGCPEQFLGNGKQNVFPNQFNIIWAECILCECCHPHAIRIRSISHCVQKKKKTLSFVPWIEWYRDRESNTYVHTHETDSKKVFFFLYFLHPQKQQQWATNKRAMHQNRNPKFIKMNASTDGRFPFAAQSKQMRCIVYANLNILRHVVVHFNKRITFAYEYEPCRRDEIT